MVTFLIGSFISVTTDLKVLFKVTLTIACKSRARWQFLNTKVLKWQERANGCISLNGFLYLAFCDALSANCKQSREEQAGPKALCCLSFWCSQRGNRRHFKSRRKNLDHFVRTRIHVMWWGRCGITQIGLYKLVGKWWPVEQLNKTGYSWILFITINSPTWSQIPPTLVNDH